MKVLDFLNMLEKFEVAGLMFQKTVQLELCEVYHYNTKTNYETVITDSLDSVGCIIKFVSSYVDIILHFFNRSEFHERLF
jgi:hypothetical protein